MPHQVRQRIQPEQSGFTLIELLVVIVIIAVLAAIAIPTFLSQSDKAEDSEAKTAARQAATAAKSYYADRETYTGMNVAALRAMEPSLSQEPGSTLALSSIGPDAYLLDITSDSGNHFTWSESDGLATRGCTTGGNAGCPNDATW